MVSRDTKQAYFYDLQYNGGKNFSKAKRYMSLISNKYDAKFKEGMMGRGIRLSYEIYDINNFLKLIASVNRHPDVFMGYVEERINKGKNKKIIYSAHKPVKAKSGINKTIHKMLSEKITNPKDFLI